SDVPVTAFSTLALVLAAARRPLASGLAMSAAIAIRPNLAPLALPISVWLARTDRPALGWFAARLAPSGAGIASLHARLYESPLVSGYGTTGDLYAVGHFAANMRQFGSSILANEPALLAGALTCLFVRPPAIAGARLLLGGWMTVVVLSYAFYQPFDA